MWRYATNNVWCNVIWAAHGHFNFLKVARKKGWRPLLLHPSLINCWTQIINLNNEPIFHQYTYNGLKRASNDESAALSSFWNLLFLYFLSPLLSWITHCFNLINWLVAIIIKVFLLEQCKSWNCLSYNCLQSIYFWILFQRYIFLYLTFPFFNVRESNWAWITMLQDPYLAFLY